MPKTVYILGAGFSKPAGAPNQAEILRDIFRLTDAGDGIEPAQQRLRSFLENDLDLAPVQIDEAPLEDIYTPIDRCIADGTCLKSKNATELARLREDLGKLISHAVAKRIVDNQFKKPGSSNYIRHFADYIVAKAARRAALATNSHSSAAAKDHDPVSVISLNWDILLDNALHWALRDHDPRSGDYDPFGVVDYCCYISSLEQNDPRIRSGLFTLGCRGFNVKLLKLHGSLNWLQCPNCQRLFVGFGEKEHLLDQVGTAMCRHCEKCGLKNRLKGSLVMPTFLKDLTNFQIKLVWQNAGVEIMEAERLVFIGYSLPHADFEFRQLLSRMVRPNAAAEVVLYEDGSPESRQNYHTEEKRYRQFFGKRELTFNSKGVLDHVASLESEAHAVRHDLRSGIA